VSLEAAELVPNAVAGQPLANVDPLVNAILVLSLNIIKMLKSFQVRNRMWQLAELLTNRNLHTHEAENS
jgi:hypothetical protein